MKERPILMSAPMIRAILDGRKTQTRRIVNPQPPCPDGIIFETDTAHPWQWHGGVKAQSSEPIKCPYGQPGDRLWVRETWAEVTGPSRDEDPATFGNKGIIYRADEGNDSALLKGIWKPSIFMRRWMSRITLEITGIRIERLADISYDDAIDEGINTYSCDGLHVAGVWEDYSNPRNGWRNPITSYKTLWESINGHGSWEANPWVWVLSFKQLIHI